MQKRAYVSIFLVLSVVLAIIFFIVYLSSTKVPAKENLTEVEELRTFVENCLRTTAQEGLVQIGLHGGYDPDYSFGDGFFDTNVPLYYDHGNNLIPKEGEIEEHLSGYISREIVSCFNEFSDFPYTVRADYYEVTIKSDLGQRNLIVTMDYPLLVEQAGSTASIEQTQVSIITSMGLLIEISQELMEKQMNAPNVLPLGELSWITKQHSLLFEILQYSSNEYVISLISNKEKLQFGLRYEWSSQDITERSV